MRFLVVAPMVPWPATNGTRIRLVATLRALASIGEVDLFTFGAEPPFGSRAVPAGEPVARWYAGRVAKRPPGPVTRLRRLAGPLPGALAVYDHAATRTDFARVVSAEYDLAWSCRVQSGLAVGSLLPVPSVVDVDDLEDHKIEAARLYRADNRPQGSPAETAHRWVSDVMGRWDVRRWRDVQARIARAARVSIVTCEADRQRLGVGNATIVPNTYPDPAAPVGRATVSPEPVVSFVGLLTYPPNRDAVRYLAHRIAPRIRARDDRIRFRMIGRHDEELALDCPGFDFTGPVTSIEAALTSTDLVVVPLRFGSGTRVKILEAFAHRIPVVSTSVGAEGLAVRDDEHLLVVDDADGFADACIRLLRDTALRARLTSAAHDLWADEHATAPFQRHIGRVVTRAL